MLSEVPSKRYKDMKSGMSDDFQTSPEVLQALYPHLRRRDFRHIWECAAGEGKLAWDMVDHGFAVTKTDIKDGALHDFLTCSPPDYDCIVTNPPYKPKDEFLARAYNLGKPFAFLLPFAALEGRKRQALYREHGLELIVLPKRPTFITPNGTVGGSWFAAAWFTWGLNIGQSLTFWDPDAVQAGLGL